jgi:hypothetical protein
MSETQRWQIGDRVARAIVNRNNFAERTGWKRGVVVGVRKDSSYNLHSNTFWYTVRWDGTTTDDGGHWQGGLVDEKEI